MKGRTGHLFTLALVLLISVLVAVGSTVIENRIRDSKQTLLSGFLQGQQGLMLTKEQDPAAARDEADRQKALADLQEARARSEAARRKLGDLTPRVEAVVAGADNRLCALIGDELVHEGGRVEGYCVRRIAGDAVEFEKGGKVWVQQIR